MKLKRWVTLPVAIGLAQGQTEGSLAMYLKQTKGAVIEVDITLPEVMEYFQKAPGIKRPKESARKKYKLKKVDMGEGNISFKQALKILGIPSSHLRHLVHSRGIPCSKVGHLLSFKHEDVLDWLANQGK